MRCKVRSLKSWPEIKAGSSIVPALFQHCSGSGYRPHVVQCKKRKNSLQRNTSTEQDTKGTFLRNISAMSLLSGSICHIAWLMLLSSSTVQHIRIKINARAVTSARLTSVLGCLQCRVSVWNLLGTPRSQNNIDVLFKSTARASDTYEQGVSTLDLTMS